MSDDPYWCPVCKLHHPVVSMVTWCTTPPEQRGKGDGQASVR